MSQTLSFTGTAQQLSISQPTVSLHVRKLEERAGTTLLSRGEEGTRNLRLTEAGQAMVRHARQILGAQERAIEHFTPSSVTGRLRLAIADDLTNDGIAHILREFLRLHPAVQVEITVGQSGNLQRRLKADQFDLALVKRYPAGDSGRVLLRDRLVWVAHPDVDFAAETTLPLVAYPTNSFTRAATTQALDRARRPWRIANTVRGVNGCITATRAGIGIGVMARSVVPDDLVEVGAQLALPVLGDIDIVVLENPDSAEAPRAALAEAIEVARGGGIR